MAGLSQRFNDAGFTLPKYMLYARDKSLFNLAVSSFKSFFHTERFLFIARDLFCTREFIQKECDLLGVAFFDIVILEQPTRGQAETVYLGIKKANLPKNEPILIFNIDTFRIDYTTPLEISNWDGYLEVFEGNGSNWSYAKTESANSTKVIQTAEKQEISSHCSTGIYYFRSIELFIDAYNEANLNIPNSKLKELYVAPLYNYLISKGRNIHIQIIERSKVLFCGVPSEYFNYLDTIG